MVDTHQRIDELTSRIFEINTLQYDFIESSLVDAHTEELNDLEAYLSYCESQGLSLTYLAQCYDLIVKDTLREQLYFQRYKQYRHSTFAEVANSVYFNDVYMRQYMHGLAITSWLWPNHREMHRYFLQHIPRKTAGMYLEIGPGHGIYMMSAMRLTSYMSFEGVDLSPASVALTNDLLESGCFGKFTNYTVKQEDFLVKDTSKDTYDAIIMGEVLEHVESPVSFLKKIRALSNDKTFIFITTPINAPAIDHIYLFDSVKSVEDNIAQSDLSIVHRLLIPYPGLSLEASEKQCLPINVAMVLKK